MDDCRDIGVRSMNVLTTSEVARPVPVVGLYDAWKIFVYISA